MKKKRWKLVMVISMMLMLLFSTITVEAATPKLSKTKATIYVGKSVTLTLNNTSSKVTWSSTNTKVATVSTKGKVIGKKAGTATIIASVSGKKYSCKVTVKNVNVAKITLSKKTASIKIGSSTTLKATVAPSNATNKAVTWKSSNTSIATVDSKGKVTGKKAGTAIITVAAKDGSKKVAYCKVTVTAIKVSSIKLSKTAVSLDTGKTTSLVATIAPSNATNKAISWSSSDTTIAAVDANGVVTGKKAGTATITVTAKDGSNKKASCSVTITEVVSEEILPPHSGTASMTSKNIVIPLGQTIIVSGTGEKWSSTARYVTIKPLSGNRCAVTAIRLGGCYLRDGKSPSSRLLIVKNQEVGIDALYPQVIFNSSGDHITNLNGDCPINGKHKWGVSVSDGNGVASADHALDSDSIYCMKCGMVPWNCKYRDIKNLNCEKHYILLRIANEEYQKDLKEYQDSLK